MKLVEITRLEDVKTRSLKLLAGCLLSRYKLATLDNKIKKVVYKEKFILLVIVCSYFQFLNLNKNLVN